MMSRIQVSYTIEEDVLVYSYLGYDLGYMRLPVETVLQWLALETIFAENKHKFFDFTKGESKHKKLFATGHRQCVDVFFIRRSLAHWVLAQGHRNFNAAVEKSCEFSSVTICRHASGNGCVSAVED